ncbi:MAG TPA: hypothetical protein VL486_00595 [Verrucomicrobiae bacterium]|nr:hypothetical protein [Verrucomicrobiae bacterium]
MKKFLRWLGIGLLVLAVVLILGRNVIARLSVEVGTKKLTGFPLEIGSVNVGLLNGKLDVRNLKLMNPPDFEEKMFVDLPEFRMDYRLGSMLAGAPHINDMLVNLKQIVVVKNAKGESNVQRLKGVTSSSSGTGSDSAKTETGKKTSYRVDQLRIHIGTVTIEDYSKGKLSERTIPLNVDATYKDITDSTDITRLVLMTMMSQVRLPDIGVNVNDLKKNLSGVTDSTGKALEGASQELEKSTKGFFNSLEKALPSHEQNK